MAEAGRGPGEPAAAWQTARAALAAALGGEPQSARELSARLSLSEHEVVEHLAHLERSFVHTGQRLVVLPSRCVACGFVFEKRARRSKPSRCPRCKSERIEPARFLLGPSDG